MNPIAIVFATIFIFCIFLVTGTPIFSQTVDFGVAYGVIIAPPEQGAINDGHLVSLIEGNYQLSQVEYDFNFVGVVDFSPDLLLDLSGDENSTPIVKTGQVYVLTSNQGGSIAIGDWLTTSSQPGIAIKANREQGAVIGQALEAYPADSDQAALILIALNPRAGSSLNSADTPSLSAAVNQFLVDLFGLSSDVTAERAYDLLRYLLAAIVIIISIIFSYYTFGRIARSGIEAVGRNPLARNSILFSVGFNVSVAAAIIFAGVIVSYLIIRL